MLNIDPGRGTGNKTFQRPFFSKPNLLSGVLFLRHGAISREVRLIAGYSKPSRTTGVKILKDL